MSARPGVHMMASDSITPSKTLMLVPNVMIDIQVCAWIRLFAKRNMLCTAMLLAD
jgi:hypothetical protein